MNLGAWVSAVAAGILEEREAMPNFRCLGVGPLPPEHQGNSENGHGGRHMRFNLSGAVPGD